MDHLVIMLAVVVAVFSTSRQPLAIADLSPHRALLKTIWFECVVEDDDHARPFGDIH